MAIFFAVSMVLGLVANAIVFIVSFQDYRSQKKSFVSTYFVLRYLSSEKSQDHKNYFKSVLGRHISVNITAIQDRFEILSRLLALWSNRLSYSQLLNEL